jgi:hypothetical protein
MKGDYSDAYNDLILACRLGCLLSVIEIFEDNPTLNIHRDEEFIFRYVIEYYHYEVFEYLLEHFFINIYVKDCWAFRHTAKMYITKYNTKEKGKNQNEEVIINLAMLQYLFRASGYNHNILELEEVRPLKDHLLSLV